MHYALCIFTMFFLCILQFRGSIQCIIQNMQYEVMRYENFDCRFELTANPTVTLCLYMYVSSGISPCYYARTICWS